MRLTEIITYFRTKERFVLLIHHSPDGDAIASSLGLGRALRALGKSVDIVCADPIPAQFHFLPDVHTIQHDFLSGDYDAIVTLDCGDSRRTGFSDRIKELVKKNRILINIDHHPKNDLHGLATYNYVDESAPSTSYLIYKVICRFGISLDYKMATCLLTGLYTDTGGFKHPNTTPEALKFASLLLSYGARLKDITYHITQLSSVPRLRLWGTALSRIKRHDDYNIVSTYLTYRDIEQTGTTEEDIAGIATLLSTIPAEISILIIQLADSTVQVRMRTKDRHINLSQLASYLGGGGQKKAAGFALQDMILVGSL
jgi:bifunctional oligoribonuclease and PAP phosphatase NrnA